MIFAIDFDGTIFSEVWPEIGEPVREVVKFIRELQERGDLWILYTMREGATLEQAVAALAGYHILLNHQPRTNREVHHTILIALAGDAHRAADEVKIGHVKLCDLTQSAATRYEKFNQCLFAVALAGIAQAFQFFDGQRLAGTLLVQF